MMSIEEFSHEMLQQIGIEAGVGAQFLENQFADYVAEQVMDAGELESFENCYIRLRGMKVNGYSFDNDSGVLNLVSCDFRRDNEKTSLTNTDVNREFGRLSNFLKGALSGKLLEGLEETSDAYQLADEVHYNREAIYRIRLFLFSNGELSKQFTGVPDTELAGVPISNRIWDLGRLYRLGTSSGEREEIVIDVSHHDVSLPCLSGPRSSNDRICQSWLSIIPGEFLAMLYDKYGSRLLEQNVRNFLQNRSKVNKGIRTTLLENPAMFLAYNNGISATAEAIDVEEEGGQLRIARLKNFQIVNGGQTTASIYSAWKKDKVDLSAISVQMKITRVEPENITEVVPLISRYSNSQNKVSDADFFSNHPFHVRMHAFSQRMWAPAVGGSHTETKWFYERTRGQYLDKQTYLSPSKRKVYKKEFPRSQMFTKTDLAKFENSWAMKPHLVSQGSQKNFARFAEAIAAKWENDDTVFSEKYFRDLIAKAIIFRHLERLVSLQSWYQGGYRANIVTYTIAWLAHFLSKQDGTVDFERIWKEQAVSEELEIVLIQFARGVSEWITSTPPQIRNVTEYCKREFCWNGLKETLLEFDEGALAATVISNGDQQSRKREARKIQRVDNDINAQVEVLHRGAEYWKTVALKGVESGELTPKEMGILEIAAKIPLKVPSERQSKVLLEIDSRLTGL